MTRILTELLTRNLDNERFVQLLEPFGVELDTLKKYGLKNKAGKFEMWGPAGMVQDFESIPIVKGSNKRGGATHDIACRTDSDPVVNKAQGAEIYIEVMHHCNDIDNERFKKSNHPYIPEPIIVPYVKTYDWFKRWGKWSVVRVWPGYFHKFPLLATCQEIAGIEGDPYVTIEKIEAAIVQAKEATEAIKAVPEAVPEKPAMVAAAEKVTAKLEDAKVDAKEKVEAEKKI